MLLTGGEWFRVRYSGTWLEEHGLVAAGDAPSLVIADAVDTGEAVVIFDAGRHGYDAMFCDEHDPAQLDARTADNVVTAPDGSSEFRLRVEVVDNIDWDDEEDDMRGDDGELRLVSGEVIDAERLRADGFDALAIVGITRSGEEFGFVEEELA